MFIGNNHFDQTLACSVLRVGVDKLVKEMEDWFNNYERKEDSEFIKLKKMWDESSYEEKCDAVIAIRYNPTTSPEESA